MTFDTTLGYRSKPLCLRYVLLVLPGPTQYDRSTCPAATHVLLALVLQLLMSCHGVMYLVHLVLLLTMLTGGGPDTLGVLICLS